MATDLYIYWLMRRDRAKPQPYSNRRRLANYTVEQENSRLVGGEFRSPFTGFNYHYLVREVEKYADEVDEDMKKSFNHQAWVVLACVIYSWMYGGWRDVVNMFVWTVGTCEYAGWELNKLHPENHDVTRGRGNQGDGGGARFQPRIA